MNGDYTLNLHSERARKARLAELIKNSGEQFLWILTLLLVAAGAYILWRQATSLRLGFGALALAGVAVMVAAWHRYDLAKLKPLMPSEQLQNVLSSEVLAVLAEPITPQSAWQAIANDWRGAFVLNHLLLHPDVMHGSLSAQAEDMQPVWREALALMQASSSTEIDAGLLTAALIVTSAPLMTLLQSEKVTGDDVREVASWLERGLADLNRPKNFFGGIGRDWTSGFTPTLERFGEMVSRYAEMGHATPFCAHEDLVPGVVENLAQGMSVALVGPDGVGKSTFVDAVAERLLSGVSKRLQYNQIVKLSASAIISAGGHQLEALLMHLFGEAIGAGNVIIFLDDAPLFFGNGVGAFDSSQLLLPVLQNRRLRLIAAFTPDEWQQLRSRSPQVAASFASITLTQPNAADTRTIVELAATNLTARHRTLVSYEAVREAIRLSGQYMQEDAYPGKAVQLLEQSMPYAEHSIVNAKTVQTALEKMRGLRVSASEAPEADVLLHLEDRIHERMINQTYAVGVVAAALRRGRAGVSNPKRPVGSFLFLGPTGVGKTELARSLAAVYFGSEKQMIRLDMTEFQTADDVRRLLAAGNEHDRSLLMQIREQPFSVVLLDEIEKAHPNVLNLLLQLLDEGQLTDEGGRPASFRSAIVIATSNAGALDIAAQVKTAGNLNDFERPLVDKLIAAGQFKPELVNRFDEVVLFRPLNEQELKQVAQIMLQEVNKTLEPQQLSVVLTDAALAFIAHEGYQPEFGARPMRHVIQKTVENAIAMRILQGQATPGSTITLDVNDLQQPKQ